MWFTKRLSRIGLYLSEFGLGGLAAAARAKLTGARVLLTVERPELRHPVFLRATTSDVSMYYQIFSRDEYDFTVQREPRIIVDAGANVGLASIYLANRYPDAQIVAVEPEASNYEMLVMNVAAYENIVPVHAALWDKNEEIDLVDPGLGECGFMTAGDDGDQPLAGDSLNRVRGMTVDQIMKEHGLERIDILKIDIEGAELEVFRDTSAWIDKVDALVIELHERMKPGCSRSFYNGSNGFDFESTRGGDVCLSRDHWLTWSLTSG